MFLRILLGGSLILALSAPSGAQGVRNPGRGPGPGMQPQGGQPVDIDGAVEGMMPGRMQVRTNTNQSMPVMFQPMTEVHLSGTATAEFLRVGLCVEFTAEIAKTGVAKDKISQLTIFTPTPQKATGLFPEGAGGTPGDVEPFAPAGGGKPGADVGPGTGKPGRKTHGKPAPGGDFAPGAAGSAAGHKGPAAGVQLPATCVVRGQIKACHGNSLTVQTGKLLVKAELADNPDIKVDVADYSMASKGDKVTVRGRVMPGKNFIQAESVKIEAAQPLGGGKKRPGKPAAKHSPAGKAPAEDDPFPAATPPAKPAP
jgi:hypothetical protein